MSIHEIKAKAQNDLFQKANVTTVGIGYKVKNGQKQSDLSIMVGVSKKMPLNSLRPQDIIPSSVDGVATDVVETGAIKAFQEFDPTQKYRPIMPGISIGHYAITAGTFGCVAKRNGEPVILSNNHVLAASNDGKAGDAIYQPGVHDGGTSQDQVGLLLDFVPLQFGGSVLPPIPDCPIVKALVSTCNKIAEWLGSSHRIQGVKVASANLVDAAIAKPTVEMSNEIVNIGAPVGTADAFLGQKIQKYGRTTHYTTGEVLQVNVSTQVSYGDGKIAVFEDQVLTGPMSQPGDSGSAILDMNKNLVGLLFAGSDQVTIFCRVSNIFSELNLTL